MFTYFLGLNKVKETSLHKLFHQLYSLRSSSFRSLKSTSAYHGQINVITCTNKSMCKSTEMSFPHIALNSHLGCAFGIQFMLTLEFHTYCENLAAVSHFELKLLATYFHSQKKKSLKLSLVALHCVYTGHNSYRVTLRRNSLSLSTLDVTVANH